MAESTTARPTATCHQNDPRLNRSAASHEIDNQHNYGYYEKQMDKAASNMGKQANEPQNEQDHQDCPKHDRSLLVNRYREPLGKEQRSCQQTLCYRPHLDVSRTVACITIIRFGSCRLSYVLNPVN